MSDILRKHPWRLAAALLMTAALLAGLALDLANRGLAWRFFWSQTGEEAPLRQISGMVEWAGNLIRPPLNTAPMTPIGQTHHNPYGINVFLQEEVEPEKRERIVQMAAQAGFTWLRQQFPWEDIEIHGRGDFEDRRNLDILGAISAWDKYDHIVALAEQYDMNMLVRLDNPPAWSRSDPGMGALAPPDDFQDFVNYAVAVAQRYRGRLRYYQVWNEPNIYPEWGEQFVDPEAYTDLLCRTYNALRAVDPQIVVVSGAIAPTISLDGMNLMDMIFVQRMYDAGARDCFDVLAAQGYGLNSGPTDRRLRFSHVSYARHQYLRDLMVNNGDAHKAIWLTEAGWNAQPADPAIVTVQYGSYGIVTEDQAARYMPLAYERAQQEWPWVGPVFYWFFKRPADHEMNQSWYYFRMAEPDFTPLPVYDSMRQFITTQQPVLYPGVYQAGHWAISLPDDVQTRNREQSPFGQVLTTNEVEFNAWATDVIVYMTGSDPPPSAEVNGEPFLSGDSNTLRAEQAGWYRVHFAKSLLPQTHRIRISGFRERDFSIDSITVLDRTYENLFPLAAAVIIALGMLAWVVLSAWRARSR
jgi:hypothetical protein